jgi:hypothetical protein
MIQGDDPINGGRPARWVSKRGVIQTMECEAHSPQRLYRPTNPGLCLVAPSVLAVLSLSAIGHQLLGSRLIRGAIMAKRFCKNTRK